MFNYIKYRVKLNKLSKSRKKIHDIYSKDIREAQQKKKSRDEIEEIKHDQYFEYAMIQEEIDILITSYLRSKANTLFVSLPEYDDEKMWTECNKISQQKVLTTLGINKIKKTIRQERKERVEIILMVAASLTGIIGAITGLIALIKK